MDGMALSPKIEREADKLLTQIALTEATIDQVYVIFDLATEERLKALAE